MKRCYPIMVVTKENIDQIVENINSFFMKPTTITTQHSFRISSVYYFGRCEKINDKKTAAIISSKYSQEEVKIEYDDMVVRDFVKLEIHKKGSAVQPICFERKIISDQEIIEKKIDGFHQMLDREYELFLKTADYQQKDALDQQIGMYQFIEDTVIAIEDHCTNPENKDLSIEIPIDRKHSIITEFNCVQFLDPYDNSINLVYKWNRGNEKIEADSLTELMENYPIMDE